MDSLVSEDSEFTYHDVIPDESVDVEKTVIHKMLLERLRDILKELSAEEMDTLNLLFFFNEDDVSERGLTEGDDSERMKLRRKKDKIFKKIRSKI
jgi:DNA-directed RNA polymerase sigma subunit (sigma70/sigma32)